MWDRVSDAEMRRRRALADALITIVTDAAESLHHVPLEPLVAA